MISTIFVLIGALLLNIIHTILAGFTYAVPAQVQTSLNWLFSSVHMLDGIFPVSDLLSAAVILLTYWGFIYLIRIFLWFISFIPGVGRHDLPSIRRKK